MNIAQAVSILENSNRMLREEMKKLRKLLEDGCSTTDLNAPYATLDKCELEFTAVQIAVEAMREQSIGADQVAGTKPSEYILHSDFKPENVHRVQLSIEKRISNYQANLAEGFTLEANEISGIVVVDLDDLITAYDPDPFDTLLDTLEIKLIGECMDSTSYKFVGVTEDGGSILVLVKGIDYGIAEYIETDDAGGDES